MAQEARAWYDAFPAPKTTASVVPRERIFRILQHIGDFLNGGPLLIDVRHTDYEGGKIRGSLNMPAQSFFMNMAVLYKLCRDADVERVIFYCGRCTDSYALNNTSIPLSPSYQNLPRNNLLRNPFERDRMQPVDICYPLRRRGAYCARAYSFPCAHIGSYDPLSVSSHSATLLLNI